MKVNPFGKRVADAEKIDQLGQRITPQHAVFFQIHDQPAVVDDERFEDARVVVLRQTAEVRVAAQVIEKIGADCAAGNIGLIAAVPTEASDDGVLNALSFENSCNRRSAEKVVGAIFVLVVARKNAAFVFKRVAERNVRDVVKQRGDPNELLFVRGNRPRAADDLEDAMRHPRCAQRMLETRMDRGRKNEVSGSELLDAAETLKLRRIHQLDLERPHFDVAVHGIANQLLHPRSIIS